MEQQAKGKTPQNSSLPPSTQHPHARPQPPRRKSKKKRGGQPGHKKHERPLIPIDQCDDVQTLRPNECRRGGAKLAGNDPEPLRHQVWELPEIKPLVTEYQRHRLRCPCCGETTCAELPLGVPQGQSGPRLMAFADTKNAGSCPWESNRRNGLRPSEQPTLSVPSKPPGYLWGHAADGGVPPGEGPLRLPPSAIGEAYATARSGRTRRVARSVCPGEKGGTVEKAGNAAT